MIPVILQNNSIRILFTLISLFLLNNSCGEKNLVPQEDEEIRTYSPEIKFDLSHRYCEGKGISSIETDSKGNVWIASGKVIYHMNDEVKDTLTIDFPVLDLAAGEDGTLWIGTNGGGLGHLDEKDITWYTKASSGLPRDYISNVERGKDGRIWFASCAHDLGGLVVYNGKKFTLFSPENSQLNQHVISDIEIDQDGSVYIVSSGTVGRANVYRITGSSWECLGNEAGTFYWVMDFSVGPDGIAYVAEDFSLSSSNLDTNAIYEYRDHTWQKMKVGFMTSRIMPTTCVRADRRNYCWLGILGQSTPSLQVYNGEFWSESPGGIFTSGWVTAIKADIDNNIWVGTSKSGVYVFNQGSKCSCDL